MSLWFFFSSRRPHTRYIGDWSSDVCSSDLNDAILIRRFSSGRIVFWNRGAHRLYGWSKKTAMGKLVYNLLETELPDPAAAEATYENSIVAKEQVSSLLPEDLLDEIVVMDLILTALAHH